ncbi:unnamed protein product, partial [Effrenium voratum]
MDMMGDGLGPLWPEPLKVTVEGRRSEAVLSPIGPASKVVTSDEAMLQQRIAVLEEENRTLRAAMATLRNLGEDVLRSLARPQAVSETRSTSEAESGESGVKPAPGLSGPEEAPTFTFTIRKADNTDMGLDVASSDQWQGLLVEGILPGGAVEAWNRQQDPGKVSRELRPGDVILQINNETGAEAMLRECTQKMLVKLTVKRGPMPQPPCTTKLPSPSLTFADTASPRSTWSDPLWLPNPPCF